MFDVSEKPQEVGKVYLIRIEETQKITDETQYLLQELIALVETLGWEIVGADCVQTRKLHAKYLCGTGKADEVKATIKASGAECLVIDNSLVPSQQRAWESLLEKTVIDRQEVILDIFSSRAKTRESRLQVELAKMQYALPRMKKMWTHLDRQGGISSRGEGEKQIEVDRRLARDKILKIKQDLEWVENQRQNQRKKRQRRGIPQVAIVGYTNAGKSSLLNQLVKSDILTQDQLFATLDTTTRNFKLPNEQEVLLTDTVGFIRELPHQLIKAFRSTLKEAVMADFLIHVVDASSKEVNKFYQTTLSTLGELGAKDKPMILFLNKVDSLKEANDLEFLKEAYPEAILGSVKQEQGLDSLLEKITEQIEHLRQTVDLKVPYVEAKLVDQIRRQSEILEEEYLEDGVRLKARIPHRFLKSVEEWVVNNL